MVSPHAAEGEVGRFVRILEVGTNVVAPVALLSALAIYFGSVRTGALYGYFGVETAVLAFSIQDYALRSVGFAFRPVLLALVATAVLRGAARLLTAVDRRIAARGWKLRIFLVELSYVALAEVILAALILCSPLATILGVADPIIILRVLRLDEPLTAAASLSVGSLILIHAVPRLVSRTGVYFYRSPGRVSPTNVLCGIAFVVGLFWGASVLAQRSGQDVAEFINARPEAQAYVTIYSAVPLNALGRDDVAPGPGPGGAFAYSDLRLLSYTNSRWFLFPGSRSADGRLEVAIVADSPGIEVVVGR